MPRFPCMYNSFNLNKTVCFVSFPPIFIRLLVCLFSYLNFSTHIIFFAIVVGLN